MSCNEVDKTLRLSCPNRVINKHFLYFNDKSVGVTDLYNELLKLDLSKIDVIIDDYQLVEFDLCPGEVKKINGYSIETLGPRKFILKDDDYSNSTNNVLYFLQNVASSSFPLNIKFIFDYYDNNGNLVNEIINSTLNSFNDINDFLNVLNSEIGNNGFSDRIKIEYNDSVGFDKNVLVKSLVDGFDISNVKFEFYDVGNILIDTVNLNTYQTSYRYTTPKVKIFYMVVEYDKKTELNKRYIDVSFNINGTNSFKVGSFYSNCGADDVLDTDLNFVDILRYFKNNTNYKCKVKIIVCV